MGSAGCRCDHIRQDMTHLSGTASGPRRQAVYPVAEAAMFIHRLNIFKSGRESQDPLLELSARSVWLGPGGGVRFFAIDN